MRHSTVNLSVMLIILLGLGGLSPAKSTASEPETNPTQLVIYQVPDPLLRAPSANPEDDPVLNESKNTEHLARILRTFARPPLRDHFESIKALGRDTIVALARPEQHDWIRDFLDLQARERETLFYLQARILTFSKATGETLGLTPEKPILLNPESAGELLENAIQTSKVEVISAPKLIVPPLQQAAISVLNRVSYIEEYTVETIQPRNENLVAPKIQTIEEGIVFDGTAAMLGEERIGLDFELSVTKVRRPIETRLTDHGEIAVPVVTKRSLASKIVLPNRGTVVVSGAENEESQIAILVQVEAIRPGEELPSPESRRKSAGSSRSSRK